MIYLFEGFDKITDDTLANLFDRLPPSVQEKAQKRTKNNKKMTILEYFCLKKVLMFDGYPDFEYGEHGKPLLKGYHFSISHADDVLCIAKAERDVGVDIEKITPYDEGVAKTICTKEEYDALQVLNEGKDRALTKLFVQKEAAIKCEGKSLANIRDILQSGKFVFDFKVYKDYMICECQKIEK